MTFLAVGQLLVNADRIVYIREHRSGGESIGSAASGLSIVLESGEELVLTESEHTDVVRTWASAHLVV